ncbi:hypothetical protein B7P43_G02975 [Cryptotermes secundus]|nr:hypothetical protein B7P43_G02975 [Cryptotermes secundus]
MLVPKSKLHQFKPDLEHITRRTPHSEIGAEREGDAVSKQESYCRYKKSQGNSNKQIAENKSVRGHQYHGEEMDTKEGESSIEKKVFQHKDNSYVPKVPCYKSGIVPMTCREEQDVMNHYRVVDQDINKDSRKHSGEKATVCIDDIHTLFDEENSYGNNDYEKSVPVIGDTNAGISVHDISDSSEDNDDIEIVHCVSKSNIGTRDYSVQQKELNYTDKPTRNNKFETADRKSSKKYNGCVIPNSSGNLIDELKRDAQQPYYRSSKAYDDIVTNGFCVQASTSVTPLCLKMHHQTPTPTPQVLPNGVYDLSCNTVIQSIGTPSSLSSVCSFELPRKRLASPVHSFKVPHGKSQNVASPYPSSSDVLSASSLVDAGSSSTLPDKKGGHEHEESVWKPAISSSSTNNFVAYSHKNIISVDCNSQEKSFEPDNQENLVPLKVIPQLTSVHDTALGTLGISHNLQDDKEIFQKEEILTNVSDSDGEKKQKSIAEDKTETQKGLRHEWECAICLEAVNSKRGISATVCGHVYCTPCITEVVCKRKECPTCRKALASAQVHPLYIFG